MSSELILNCSICYQNDGSSKNVQVANLETDVLGTLLTHTRQSVPGPGSGGTPGVELDLSGVGVGGYLLMINRDKTNGITYHTSSVDDAVVEIKPLEMALFRTSTETTAPWVEATTGSAAELEFWLFDGTAAGGGPATQTQLCIMKVRAKTTAALPANTYNGTAFTLTGNANGALAAQDGVTLVVGDALLVNDEATGSNNGIYTVTTVGDGSNPYVLTRHTDLDATAEFSSGLLTPVSEGTSFADTLWMLATNDTITLDTTSLLWSRIGGVNITGTDHRVLRMDGTDNIQDSSLELTDNVELNSVTTEMMLQVQGQDALSVFYRSAAQQDVRILATGGLHLEANGAVEVHTLTANETLLSYGEPHFHIFTADSDYDINLPTEALCDGMWFWLSNADGVDTFTVKDPATSTIVSLSPGSQALVVCDGNDWRTMGEFDSGGGGGGGTVSGTGTDNRIARWDGAADIQDSDILVTDTGDLTFISSVVTPIISSQSEATGSSTGTSLSLISQDKTGGNVTAGALLMRGGNATGAGAANVGGGALLEGGTASGGTANTGGDVILKTGGGATAQGTIQLQDSSAATQFQVDMGATEVETHLKYFSFHETDAAAPFIRQNTDTVATTGDEFTIHAQDLTTAGGVKTAGQISIRGGNSTGGATNNGGNVNIRAGAGDGTGTHGTAQILDGAGSVAFSVDASRNTIVSGRTTAKIQAQGDDCFEAFYGDANRQEGRVVASGGLRLSPGTADIYEEHTLVGNETLAAYDEAHFHKVTMDTDRDFTLPTEADSAGHWFLIANADTTDSLDVRTGAGSLQVLDPEEQGWFVCDGTNWICMGVVCCSTGGNGFTWDVVSQKSGNYTASIDELVPCDVSGGGFTITLPTAVGNTGRSVCVKNVTTSTNNLVVSAPGAEAVDGTGSVTLSAAHATVTCTSNGSGWLRTASAP